MTVGVPFRIGLLCRGTTLRAWQADVVRQLLALPDVTIDLLVVDARPALPATPAARVDRLVRSPHLVWDTYNNGWVSRAASSLAPVDLTDRLGDVPRLDVVVEESRFAERLSAADLEAVRAHELDVLLRFAFGILRGPVLEAARHGVWSFHHGDEEHYRGSPPAFWELADGAPVAGTILQRLTERLDGGVVIEKGWFPVVGHSYARTTDALHLGATAWPARAVERVRAGEVPLGEPSRSTAPILRKPDNGVAARFLLGQAARFVGSQARALTVADQWEVGVVHAPIHRFLDPLFEPRVVWQRLGVPRRHYAADPFFLDDGDDGHILYERFDAQRRHGEIWQVAPGDPASARPAGLPVSAHASYPFVVRTDGRTYCLPQVDDVGVPVFEHHGDGWRHAADLLPGERVLDPTVVWWRDHWWLFGTRPGATSLTQLHLWSSAELTSGWRAHPLNPVLTDARCARSAGTPFVHEGRLYRPAQDCSSGYGGAVALAEVTQLDDERFAQRVVRIVRPSARWPFGRGVHTLSAAGSRTLLDARRGAFDPHESAAELRARLVGRRPRAHGGPPR